MTAVCDSCQRYKDFKEKCWFFWQQKQECSRFAQHSNAEETFHSVKEHFDILHFR